jgi:hypothetical protein
MGMVMGALIESAEQSARQERDRTQQMKATAQAWTAEPAKPERLLHEQVAVQSEP